ncbi:MAG: succinylglutamate desuccinylase/aspartoacylase family protein [Planctomycetota bacterium]
MAGVAVPAGERQLVELHLTRLYTSGDVVIPVHVVHGRQDGPKLFVSAAVHGDEINGVEAIRRLLQLRLLDRLHGTLIAIPVVNVHGFLAKTRYTPDRRDLNRSFPGLAKGSLAARVARAFMKEVVARCTHGIDLHTGSNHRTNLPHVRANLDDAETRRLAEAFGAPVMINAKLRDGSLRQAAMEHGIPMLLFEGGEALRFEPTVIQATVRGVVGVMQALGMLKGKPRRGKRKAFLAESTNWVRAPESGLLISDLKLGTTLEPGQELGFVSDPFGKEETPILATKRGIVIGRLNLPLVNEGDALFHVAHGENLSEAEVAIQELVEADPDLPYEPPELGQIG